MNALKNPKAIALVTTALCTASIVWLMSTHQVNRNLESSLEKEKLRSESILSQKLLLEKEMEKMRGQLSGLKGSNSELDKVVRTAEARLSSQEAELKKLKYQNASLGQMRKQREALLEIQKDLENQLTSLQASYYNLENNNMELRNTIAQLQKQNSILSDDLKRAMFAAIDRSQVQAVRGKKDKLTVRARQAQKLVAKFEVPASLDNISYRILDPRGNPLSDKLGTISSTVEPANENIIASAGGNTVGNGLQKITMEYRPKAKMHSGVYTVEILNDNLYVGSMNVKLR